MAVELKTITENYKTDDEIANELETNLEYALDFDRYGQYEFVLCGECGGLRIGHK